MAIFKGPEFYISKHVGRAIIDYKMIEEGDRILVAVSGGRDSLALLKVLADRQRFVPLRYSLIACHLDTRLSPGAARGLERYIKGLGVECHVVRAAGAGRENMRKKGDASSFWRWADGRKKLCEAAVRLKCTKIALGQHLDDIAEAILMNLFFEGEVAAMEPRQEFLGGKIAVIRPLCYTEESLIGRFAPSLGFSRAARVRPDSRISPRGLMRGIIADLRKVCPEVRTNIFRSVRRIKSDYLP